MGQREIKNYTTEDSIIPGQIEERIKKSKSDNVITRAEEFLERLNQNEKGLKTHLLCIKSDFYSLVEDPNDEVGGGNYDGWTSDEIKELYYIIYGEHLEIED